MTFHFRKDGCLKVSMIDHVEDLLRSCPALFIVDPTSPKLNLSDKELFHSLVAKGLFISKRARPDIAMTISVLSSRVANPNQSDKKKLIRMVQYLRGTKQLTLTLGIENMSVVKWPIDASFVVHPDFRGHSGGCMTWGKGCPISVSTKQKLNSRSSTESKIIVVDDLIDKVLWTKLFLAAQGVNVSSNIIQQDKESTIKLENNGRWSAGKRSKAINI